jgi:DNA-binding MarR family transcriptional regulator
MNIARSECFTTVKQDCLPLAWSILYDLARLEKTEEGAVIRGIEDGTITAQITRIEARKLIKSVRDKKADALGEPQ